MKEPIDSQVTSPRAELAETLAAIEDKLNIGKQGARLRVKAVDSYHANPIPWVVGATAAVIALGGIIAWAVLSNDD